jgi:hypothetical protein
MPARTGTFDPYTGFGSWVDELGITFTGYAEDFTHNDYGIGMSRLWDMDSTELPTMLGSQGLIRIQDLGNSRYDITSQTLQGQINRITGENILRVITGEVTYLSEAHGEQTFTVNDMPISRTNYQWIAYVKNDGTMGYTTLRGPFANDAEVAAAYGFGSRLATPEEAIYSSVMKAVIANNTQELERVIQEFGLTDETGATKEYQAARLVMKALNLANFSTFARTVIERD